MLCPVGNDRARNQHRHTAGWSVTTVKAILENPRYTGRQPWSRQAVHHHLDDGTIIGGNEPERMRNARQRWVISAQPARSALVSGADFVAVQNVDALPCPADGTPRDYQLVGVLRCAYCDVRTAGAG